MRNKFLFFALAFPIFFCTWAGAAIHTVVGDLRIMQFPATSQYPARTIRVWLPSDYEKTHRSYPVLYMMDGQNCFDRDTSAFGKEWQIDETLTQLIDAHQLPPLIVVGIDNSPSRIDEYTFFADPKYGGGHGQAYADVVIHRLQPFVEKSFRVETDPQHVFIGGSSLGGLAALEITRRNPHTFGGVIAMSPSLWWDKRATIAEINRDPGGLAQARIWLDV
ncbi:MAG TPA: alpha/beta hydrolase-fold protein, partial [Tepidisphaeraceae bacterium]